MPLAVTWFGLFKANEAEAHLVPHATAFVLTGIITPSDRSACTVKAAKPAQAIWGPHLTVSFGNTPKQYKKQLYWIFNASCDGGSNTFEVRILVADGYTARTAAATATKYAKALGRLPKVLRTGIKGVSMSSFSTHWTAQVTSGEIFGNPARDAGSALEEALVHEAVHASLDPKYKNDARWLAAQLLDGTYISRYAEQNPKAEDLAESFVAYLGARFRPGRISSAWEKTIFQKMPNRIAFFDSVLSTANMKPFSAVSPDEAGLVVYGNALSMNVGSTVTYEVRLLSPPDASVTVTPASAAASIAKVSGALTFTKRNWHIPQTVSVSGIAKGKASITHTATSSDSNYKIKAAKLPSISAAVTAAGTLKQFDVLARGFIFEGLEKEFSVSLRSASRTKQNVTLPRLVVTGAGITDADYKEFSAIEWTKYDWSKRQKLQIYDNDVDEPTKVITLAFAGRDFPEGTQPGTRATLNLRDNDPTSVTLMGTGDVAEGSEKIVTVALGRALVSGEALSVPLVFGGAAVRGAGDDYTVSCSFPLPAGVVCRNLQSGNATVTFTGPSAKSAELTFAAHHDGSDEGSETVSIGLGPLNSRSGSGLDGGAKGFDQLATFHILETSATPTVSLSVDKAAAKEGSIVTVTASVSKSLSKDVVIPLTISQSSSAGSADYTLLAKSITIWAGSTLGNAQILFNSDSVVESNENLVLALGTIPSGLAAGSARVVQVQILDHQRGEKRRADTPQSTSSDVTVTISGDAGRSIKRGGTKNITFRLSRPLAAGEKIKVRTTIGGTGSGTAFHAPQSYAGWGDYALTCESPLPIGVSCPKLNTYISDESVSFTFTGPSASSLTVKLSTAKKRAKTAEKIQLKFSLSEQIVKGQARLIENVPKYVILASDGTGTSTCHKSPKATLYVSAGDGGSTEGRASRIIVTEGSKATVTISLSHCHSVDRTYNLEQATDLSFSENGATKPDIKFKNPKDYSKLHKNHRNRNSMDITMPAGTTEASTVVDVVDDGLAEGVEVAVFLTLNLPGHSLADPFPRAEILILDKSPPKIEVSPWLPVTEGGKAGFTITSDQAVENDTNVKLTIAESGSGDFVSADDEGSKTVTILKGKKSTVYSVNTNGDTVDEPDGAVTVTVEADSANPPTYIVSASASASVKVSDDDLSGTPVDLSISNATINEGAGALTVTATLSSANTSGAAISIPIAVNTLRSTAGTSDLPIIIELKSDRVNTLRSTTGTSDYTIASSISIPNGAISATTPLAITDDSVDELAETVTVELDLPLPPGIRAGKKYSVTATVIDNDPTRVSLSRSASDEVDEGDSIEFSVTLGRALVAGETVDVPLVMSGDGVTDSDFDNLAKKSGSNLNRGVSLINADTLTPVVRFSGTGARVAELVLAVTNDATSEAAETLTVALGPDGQATNGFDLASRSTNVDGGASPQATDNAFDVEISDRKEVAVTPSILSLIELNAAHAAKTYTLVLNSDPGADVEITITSSDTSAVTVDTDPNTDGDQSTLTFTHGDSGTWNDEQSVTVRAVNDADATSESKVKISHVSSVGSDTTNGYHGITVSDVTVYVTDAGHGVTVSTNNLSNHSRRER